MTEADRIFGKFPEFIREYIYSHSWDSLRDIQLFAAKALFKSDDHLLLTSSTASGKTEAVFFPILADLVSAPREGISVLYIAPLKSLINDQFQRIDDLLKESGIRVTHWHGDVAASAKKRLLKDPEGILQITPESLEAMLINRSNDIPRLFSGLSYIIIDELHTLGGTDRGSQIICQIERIEQLIGREVRRLGLSATLGDPNGAARWLRGNSHRQVAISKLPPEKIHWRLGLEHFFIQDQSFDQTRSKVEAPASERALFDAGYEYVYECVRDKKAIVFSNSREETEYVCATLRQIANKKNERDVFLIHHGNISAALREEAELKMKDGDSRVVTCATVTMELGIDIGKLERIMQIDAPNSVSSFLQRLGRSGRRGQPPEMMMVFREEEPLPNAPLPQLIPWGLIRGIAIIQLYTEERFMEPLRNKKEPLSLLFHQTLSILASCGEMKAARLAQLILSMPPFADIAPEIYKALLVSMLNGGFLEMTEERGLIVGLSGEKLLSSFKFYAVFNDSEDFTVRCESEEIGTITSAPPVGDRFALAGRVWEVVETDSARRLVYVKKVEGKMEVSWPGDYGEIHTRILERMKRVLSEDTVYPYLKENAVRRLEMARAVARNTGMTERSVLKLGGYTYCIFPWLGTRSFRTLRKMIRSLSAELCISGIDFEGCYFLTFRMEKGNEHDLLVRLHERFSDMTDPLTLVSPTELPSFEKYDKFIPGDLLRHSFAADRLNVPEAVERISDIYREFYD